MIKAFLTLSGGNLFSKALGLTREILLAWAYGLGATAAAIRIAMAAVFIPINLLTQDILAAGYLPLYQTYKEESESLAKQYAFFFTLLMFLTGLLITAILWPIAQAWIGLIASGLPTETQLLASQLFRLFLLATPFILISSAATYGLMGNNYYALQALRPSVQNIGLISGILLASYFQQTLMLGYLFLAAQLFFCCLALFKVRPYLATHGISQKTLLRFAKDLWRIMKPLLLLPVVLQGYIVLERNVASWLSTETVAALEVTKFITETAMALLAVPLGLIVLSRFSKADQARSQRIAVTMAKVISLILTPAAAVLLAFPEVLIQTLFQRGAFTTEATTLTANILRLFGFGILLHSLNYQLLKMANAFQLSQAFLIANIVGLVAGAAGLLSYPVSGNMAFGIAYLFNGFASMLYLANCLHCLKQLIKTLVMAMAVLSIVYLLTDLFVIDSFSAQLLSAASLYLLTTAVLALPYLRRTKTLNVRVWFQQH